MEVWTGIERIVQGSLAVMQKIRNCYDLCTDPTGPNVILATEPIRNAYFNLKERGIKIRMITDVSKGNLADVKEFMKLAEIRHLDGIIGNFVVADKTDYAGSPETQKGALMTLVVSNISSFVRQQQYFFEMLWDKAMPVELRIKELEQQIEPEITEVIYGEENIIKAMLPAISVVDRSIDAVFDRTGPSILCTTTPIKEALEAVLKRGIRIRMITEVTIDNISFCKILIALGFKIRHLDAVIRGHFSIADGKRYVTSANTKENRPLPSLIRSNISEFVEQQQYFFDTLWNKSIPAEQRFRQIEEGIEPEFIETITDTARIQKLTMKLTSSANKEILGIFSTPNAFRRQLRAGSLDIVRKRAEENGIIVKILTPVDDDLDRRIVETQGNKNSNFFIRAIDVATAATNRISLLVVDRKYSIAVEVKEDEKLSTEEAIGLSTYSNSKATVLSYVSIFETLWSQTELHKQLIESNAKLQLQDKMQKDFISIAAHELRTPIQPILGLAEVLHRQFSSELNTVAIGRQQHNREDENIKENEEENSLTDTTTLGYRELLEVIIRNARRLERLTDDILDVARIDRGNLQLKNEEINLINLIDNIVKDYRKSLNSLTDANGRRIDIVFLASQDIDDDGEVTSANGGNNSHNKYNKPLKDVYVIGDSSRLTQVIANLFSNSMKSIHGDGTITVTVIVGQNAAKNDNDTSIAPGQVHVIVCDDGAGIEPEILPSLFGRFVSNSDKGTGLGLFISKSIIEAHGGRIWAENNKDGKGATFGFSLPIVHPNPDPLH